MISNYAATLVLKAMLGKASSVSLGSNCYVGLSSTAPNKDGSNVTEPTAESYERVILGNYSQLLTQKMGDVNANNEISNTEIIYFPEALTSWGTLTHFVVFDGNLANSKVLSYGQLTNSITPSVNSVPLIRVGELVISLT